MKRRILAIALVLLLLAALVPVGSASGIFFVAYNDTVPMTLSTDVAPYYQSGILLVPHTAFGVNGLGVTASYDAESRVVSLVGKDRRLTFNMTNGIARDENGVERKITCVMRNGVAFLPAGFCTAHLGISVSLLTSRDQYTVLRFTNGTQAYDDGLFIQKAENLIAFRIRQYESELAASQQPVAPQIPSADQPGQQETPDEKLMARVFLAVESIETVDAALRTLSGWRIPAVFFLTAQEMQDNPQTVMEIRAAGFSIGLTVREDAENVAAELAAANSVLDDLTQTKSLLVLLSAQQKEQAEGYFVVSRSSASTEARVLQGENRNYLLICRADCSAVVSRLRSAKADFYQLRETTVF